MALRARTRIARGLRRDATEAEARLWRALRPIGPYIVDFACPAQQLAIELDGGQHATQLSRHPLWNNEVMQNLAGVLETVRQEPGG